MHDEEDERLIRRTYELARHATTHGGEPFGALLYADGAVVGEFANDIFATGDVTRHAECGLISTLGPKLGRERLARCTLYTSTEPCAMCCGAVGWSGIRQVVYGTGQGPLYALLGGPPTPEVPTSRELLARIAPRVAVRGPVLEAEGLAVHRAYWKTGA